MKPARTAPVGRTWPWLAAILAALAAAFHAPAQHLPDAAPGLVEAGAPPFVVLGLETLGLNAAPTDLRLMPDGRLLVIAPQQLVLGDGVRWQNFRQAPTDTAVGGLGGAVDRDGQIYLGQAEGGARVHFGADGTWRLELIAPWTPAGTPPLALPQSAVTEAGDEWIWHSLTGVLVAWRPGETPRAIGKSDTYEKIFTFRGSLYLSERFNGRLTRLRAGAAELIPTAGTSMAISCTQPLDDHRLLAGTYGAGLTWFDGEAQHAFPAAGPLMSGARINDLCTVAPGVFAAAVDNHGVVFFDHTGRTVQALDRTLDHRLARVKALRPAPGGTLWGLLDDGVLRIDFPSPVSNFEALIGAGFTTVHPYRVDGRLWLLADGKAQRAGYDDDGRLNRFTPDTPVQAFATSFCSAPGFPIVGTERGAFFREPEGWTVCAPAAQSLRILDPAPVRGRWLYSALDEIGWLEVVTGRPAIAARWPAPGLSNVFNNAIRDGDGAIWLELGSGRIGRVRSRGDVPQAEIFTEEHGVPPSWPQIFTLDGEVRFNMAQTILRFDEATYRFARDDAYTAQFPGITAIYGRPGCDGLGRLWLTADGAVHVFEKADGVWRHTPVRVPVGFQPYYFTFEPGGVVWMHAQQRLARFDPAMPEPAPASPLRAMITQVTFTATQRCLYPTTPELPPLDFAENSLLVHFVATGNSFAAAVTFDVKLEGSGEDWVTTGSAGSAAFNRLKEGNYVLHVRPRAGATTGAEARLAFSIRPPWFRTILAYVIYALATLALIVAIFTGWTWLNRREQARLARLVLERTTELRRSEERFRRLNEELEQRVDTRTGELHRANDRLLESNQELEAFSYSVSHDLRAPLRNISGFAELLRKRASGRIDGDTDRYLGIVSTESVRLGELIDSLLVFSRLSRAELNRQPLELDALVAAARAELAPEAAGRTIEWHVGPLPRVDADATLLRQVFVNLLSNALKFTRSRNPAVIEIGMAPDVTAPGHVVVFVRDNGAGFDPKYADKMFGVFQRLHSSREYEGSGIGLATVRRIVARHGGRVWAEGQPGRGAAFFVSFPAAATVPPASAKAE